MEEMAYRGKVIQVTTEAIGGITWERAYLPHGVVIFPVNDEGKILFIRERRPHETPPVRLKPVTGMIEPKQTPLENALRELQEEIGYKAGSMQEFWQHHSNGTVNSSTHFFLAKHLSHEPIPNPDGDIIEAIVALTPQEVRHKIESEEIRWGVSVMGWLKLEILMNSGKMSLK